MFSCLFHSQIMTDKEIDLICEAVKQVALHHKEWGKDYEYSPKTNEYAFKDGTFSESLNEKVCSLFEGSLA